MASSRRYIRDARGRFSGGGGGGVISRARKPRRARPRGEMTRTLRASVEALKQGDRRMSLAMTGSAAGPILSKGRRAAPGAQAKVQQAAGPRGRVTDALGSTLRSLAQSDARFYRDLSRELSSTTKQIGGGKAKAKPKALRGSRAKPKRLGGTG